MFRVKITVIRKASYPDLMEKYELPLENPCCMEEGQSFLLEQAEKPVGFCDAAWNTLKPFVEKLLQGEGHFYGEWMKDPYTALLSCDDGFRPVSFLLERVED